MILIDHYIFNDKIELEIKLGYEKNYIVFKSVYNDLLKSGFSKNRYRNTWRKVYYTKEYTQDRFENDINMLKSLSCYFRMRSFKMLNSEQNFREVAS